MENVWDGHDCPMCGSDDTCSCDWRTEIERLREKGYHKLDAALQEITELDPGLWDTMQKIARKALGMEP